jgi:glycosyltransferase involved in cell wall biosynthesis
MSVENSTSTVDILVERQWHVGIHARALSSQGWLGRIYGGFPRQRYEQAGIDLRAIRTFALPTLWNELGRRAGISFLPKFSVDRWLARWVAAQKDLNRYVACYATAYRHLFPLLKNRGNILILERGSTHPENFFLQIQLGRKEAGFSYTGAVPTDLTQEIEAGKMAHFIVAGSEAIAASYVERGYDASRILRIPYGTDEATFSYYARESRQGGGIRVACVGVIGIRKGLPRLLRLGEWAAARSLPLELVLIGPLEPEAKKLLAKTKASYSWLGVRKGQDLVRTLHECDLYCLPSYEEGFGISVLEAMSTGLPAIISQEVGSREAITHKRDGIILRNFDSIEFESTVLPLLQNKSLRIEMGREARAKVEKRYTVSAYVKRLVNEYRRMFGIVENSSSSLKAAFVGQLNS